MKVGITCPYAWDVPGGVQVHVHDLAVTLIGQGHDVSVLAPIEDEDSEIPNFVVNGGKPVSVPFNGSVAKLNIGVKATRVVRSWIREHDFDVLHVHEPISPSLSLLACWSAQGPIVATWHSSYDRSRLLAASRLLAQTAMEKVSARIAVSEYARRTLVDHLGGDAVLIPNGVCVADYADPAILPGYEGRDVMAFLGRMDESRKGFAIALEALPAIVERHPNALLLVVGPGDEDDARKLIPSGYDSHVKFLGRVSAEEKSRALHTAKVYLAPNTGGESFGIVLLEAMASGTPVVASDLDAFVRVLADGECGLVFENGNADSLAEQVDAVLSDPALAERLRVAGLARAWQYDWNKVAEDVLHVYESVTVTGDRVREDLRGQIVGRFASLTRAR